MVRVKIFVLKVCLWWDYRWDYKFYFLNFIIVLLYIFDNLRDIMYCGYIELRFVIFGVCWYCMYM